MPTSQLLTQARALPAPESAAIYQQLLMLPANDAADPETLMQFLFDAGQDEKLEAFTQSRLKTTPKDGLSLSMLGLALARQKKPDAAVNAITKALTLEPKNADFHARAAHIFLRLGKAKEAEKACDKAMTLDSENAEALVIAARLRINAGQSQDALWILHQVTAAKPDVLSAYLARIALYEKHQHLTEAFAETQAALRITPWSAEAAIRQAHLLLVSGQYAQVLAVIEQTLAFAPATASIRTLQAQCWFEMGKPEAGIPILLEALKAYPQELELLPPLACSLVAAGHYAECLKYCEMLLAKNPTHPLGLVNRATAYYNLHRFADATADCETLMQLTPENVQIYQIHTEACRRLGRGEDAMRSAWISVRLAPNNTDCWNNFANAIALSSFSEPDAALEKDLAHCLSLPQVDKTSLWIPSLQYLMLTPGLKRACDLAWADDLAAITAGLRDGSLFEALAHPIMLPLLEGSNIPAAGIEKLHTIARRGLLHLWLEKKWPTDARLQPYLQALAQQCFRNEYVYYVGEDEKPLLEALKTSLQQTQTLSDAHLLLACYEPLSAMHWLDTTLQSPTPAAYATLVRQQWTEPMQERALRSTIQALTPVEDWVSKAVQGQYEVNPYPRWVHLPILASGTYKSTLKSEIPMLQRDPDWSIPADAEVLIAGCGTGQHPLHIAQMHPNIRLLAVDLSLSSLSYAKRKGQEYGITNVAFGQADILHLPSLGRQFDVIESVGVIHHMHDPMAGWEALYACLKPGGLLRLGLYSELARKSVVACRTHIAEQGYSSSVEDIRRFRHMVFAEPEDSAIAPIISSPDFYALSNCRDLLFHVQEHRFTIPMLKEALARFHMEFMGFSFRDRDFIAKNYTPHFPDDPFGRNLDNWQVLETGNPRLFGSMYNFYARKHNESA